MNARRHWFWAGLLCALLGAGGIGLAFAQDSGSASDGSGDGTGEDGAVGVTRSADLEGPEQLAEAERISSRANQLSTRVLGMLDEARRDGDIVRVTCLDDKLTQINAHRRTLGDRVDSLSESINTGDDARRNHEYTVISVLGQNFSQLERDANECVGSSLYDTGTTRVITEIDPNTPTDDPSVLNAIPLAPVPSIPPPASI